MVASINPQDESNPAASVGRSRTRDAHLRESAPEEVSLVSDVERIAHVRLVLLKNVRPENTRARRSTAYPRSASGGWMHLDAEEAARGPLLRGAEEVHHRNRSTDDYVADNLVRLSPHDHGAIHGRVRALATEPATVAREDTLRAVLTSNDSEVLQGWRRALTVDDDAHSWVCPLGSGSQDRAMLTFNHDGELVYYRLYPCRLPFLTIGEAFRAIVHGVRDENGEVTRIPEGNGSGASYAAWGTRAAFAGGLLVPKWMLPESPDDAGHAVVIGVSELFICRGHEREGVPIPLTRGFVAEWCGVSEWKAREGIEFLADSGRIVQVGTWGTGARVTPLWLPRASGLMTD